MENEGNQASSLAIIGCTVKSRDPSSAKEAVSVQVSNKPNETHLLISRHVSETRPRRLLERARCTWPLDRISMRRVADRLRILSPTEDMLSLQRKVLRNESSSSSVRTKRNCKMSREDLPKKSSRSNAVVHPGLLLTRVRLRLWTRNTISCPSAIG